MFLPCQNLDNFWYCFIILYLYIAFYKKVLDKTGHGFMGEIIF